MCVCVRMCVLNAIYVCAYVLMTAMYVCAYVCITAMYLCAYVLIGRGLDHIADVT
jgi:hypothetical protein